MAEKLVRFVGQGSPSVVLDPAAGDGALLAAANSLWPDSRKIALDCDPIKVRSLYRRTGWNCGRCNFLSLRSRACSPLLREIYGNADVVLLNPPYSGRGNAGWLSVVGGTEVRSGRAMAFVLGALEALRDGGEMVALLPSSTITSQRDSYAWEIIYKHAQVTIVHWFPRGTFSQGTAVTVGVHFCKSAVGGAASRQAPCTRPLPDWEVRLLRGNVPVHEAKEAGLSSTKMQQGIPFLHTTDIRGGKVVQYLRTLPEGRFDSKYLGPAVLVPRVGKPLSDKIGLWHGGIVVLSDCVFGIDVGDVEGARRLQSMLCDSFSLLASIYKGSCAPYLTISSLINFLADMGISARWDGPARWTTAAAPDWSPSNMSDVGHIVFRWND